MAETPNILGYGKTHGLSIHTSEDRSSIDAVIRPYKSETPAGQPIAVVATGLGLLAPLAGAFWVWRSKGELWFFLMAVFIVVMMFPAVLWMMKESAKWEIRIHADRKGLSLDRQSHDNSIRRSWERDEIRGIRVERLPWNMGRKWGVFIHLSLVDPLLADRLHEADANTLANALRMALDLPDGMVVQSPLPSHELGPTSTAPPMLDYGSVPSRHGVLIERTTARLTIIIPQRRWFIGISRREPEAIIELDHQSLSIDCIDRGRDEPTRRIQRSWLRGEILNVKGDLYAMGLTIRVAGKDLFEMLHRYPQELRVWIARTLDSELREAWGRPSEPDSSGKLG